ncbi:MAG: ABC transporter ATP-binding protein, partial [Clostridia bacterium]|nr:ABC transporter ATP-binding protein [Clostridia bacterium]
MKPLLQIENLEITFGHGPGAVRAASGVSFSVYPGEVLGVVGESGSGKSITALSVMGLLARQGRVTGGRILFEGQDLLKLSAEQLDELRGTQIGMIFQDIMYSLNPVLTIGLQMTEGMRRHLKLDKAEAGRRAEALLTRTGIRDAARVMKKYPHQLSGGMRQRVM